MTVGCLVAVGGSGNAAAPDRGGTPPGEFYAPAGLAPESLSSEGIFPRGRRLAFMGYSGDPARDLTRGFTVAGPVYGDQSAYLQRCFEHHWPVVAHVGLRVTFNDKSPEKYRLDESELRATIAKQIENLAPHPEIVWWAVTPEELRPWRGDEMRYLQIVADTVRDTDPLERPIYLYNPNHRDAATLTPIAKHVDILAKGCYVNLTGKKRDRTWVRWSIEQEVGALARAGRSDTIPLLMPELCQDPAPGEEDEIPQWVRHDIYLGLISGAKGVGIWSLFKRKEVRRTWQRWYDAYAACGRELNGKDGLAEVFLFGERRHDLAIHQASPASEARVPLGGDVELGSTSAAERTPRNAAIPSWTAAEIAHRQSRYVFLVNSANEAAIFTVAGWPAGSAADSPFDGKAVKLPADGSLKINLPPYGVAALRFSRATPRIESAPASTNAGRAGPPQGLGPALGHVDHESARIWLRPSGATEVALVVRDLAGKTVFSESQLPQAEHDHCLTWVVTPLQADTPYRYAIHFTSAPDLPIAEAGFCTAPQTDRPSRAVLAFGSCASEKFPGIWQRIATEGADAVVLTGDTPYIDSSKLETNRERHRAFLAQRGLAELIRERPLWSTWDDHDFGGNDSDGKKVDREAIRTAFVEYRALASFGEHGAGIYTRFRRGPIEVFLIDARYFSQAEPSPIDPAKPTLLGKSQWDWLRKSLGESTAPFKVLATGMVWHDKPGREKDDWETYAHEREALFSFLHERRIGGVVLLGGDVHVSLKLEHLPPDRLRYSLFEYVISPLHDRVIPDLVPTKDKRLLWSAAKPNVFLKMVGDSTGPAATLTSTWIQMDGTRLHEHVITAGGRD